MEQLREAPQRIADKAPTRISEEVRCSRPETGLLSGDLPSPDAYPRRATLTEASRAGVPGRAQTVAEQIERLALRDLLPDSGRCIANSEATPGGRKSAVGRIGSTNGPAWSKFGATADSTRICGARAGPNGATDVRGRDHLEVTEDELDRISATALGKACIHTQGDTTDDGVPAATSGKQSTVISTTA